MKTMKQTWSVLPFSAAITLAFGPMLAPAAPAPHSHDMLLLLLQTKMSNGGVLSNANGTVDLHENEHGSRANQEIHVNLNHLEAGATYQLTAASGDNSNITSVVEFTADAKGHARLDLRDNGQGTGMGTNGVKGKLPLPADWEPVSTISALAIVDTNGQTVLTADLTTPEKLEYLVTRDLSTNTVKAKLQINAHTHKALVRVTASGLTPNAAYSLALNGTVAQTGNADKKGKLKLETELPNATDILALQSVALLDDGGSEVVSTTLP
jgi:hypothetical protein